ncbi:hypothetical protein AVEN_112521-1 [Araneus ventricosus]|uniref:Uncharacterized protein n=1 Tax=Araneus ventricosus TaxID=182803 RepID=A0A4Y2URU8_ARAVE|nr:hypothetical protein AVEN_112521-1 [Araneus ventricosus]
MDDNSRDTDKTSFSVTKETELLSSQKEEVSASELQQLSPKSSDLSQGVEFSNLEDNSETASEQGNIKSVHFLQTNKESETSESENDISRSPSTIKTKMCEEPIVVAGAKRRKSDHSTSDRGIEDKPRIPADPDCSGRTAVEVISLGPSTSAGANRSYDSLELQGKSTNLNQEVSLICAQVRFPALVSLL